MEAAGDIPAEGASEGGALAEALGRATTSQAGWVVETRKHSDIGDSTPPEPPKHSALLAIGCWETSGGIS